MAEDGSGEPRIPALVVVWKTEPAGTQAAMDVVLFIIGIAISGLIVGALGRLLLPGKDPMSLFQTMLIGIAGSLIAGLIAYYAFDREEGAGFLASVVCTIGLVYAVRTLRRRRERERASANRPGQAPPRRL